MVPVLCVLTVKLQTAILASKEPAGYCRDLFDLLCRQLKGHAILPVMELTIEIRAAEGGDDAKLLVADQASLYINYAKRNSVGVKDVRAGKG